MSIIRETDLVNFPICVDLDGTLWPGDCLWLCATQFLKKNSLGIFKILFWWVKGRTHLKRNLLECVSFEQGNLKYFSEIMDYLLALKKQGAKIYLVTGSDQEIADKVSGYLNIFEGAYGSSLGENLVGEKKAELLNKLFCEKKYVYFGNEWKDRLVWQHSAAAFAVNVDKKTQRWLESQNLYIRMFNCKT